MPFESYPVTRERLPYEAYVVSSLPDWPSRRRHKTRLNASTFFEIISHFFSNPETGVPKIICTR
jgi:hypothetical protein